MKSLTLVMALALATAPAAVLAQQQTTPEPGGTSQGPLAIFTSAPLGTVVVSGFVVSLVTGLVVGVLVDEDSTVVTSTTTTN